MTHWLAAIVRGVLMLAPVEFRTRYRVETADTLALALEAERSRRGAPAMLVLFIRSLVDTVRTIWRERRLAKSGWLTDLSGDLRSVLRGWRRQPGFFATIVLTLTLGLGLSTAIFSFADGYLFRPLPFEDSDRLYNVRDPQATPAILRASDTEVLRRSPVAEFGFVEWSPFSRAEGAWLIDGRRVEVFGYEVSEGFRSTVALPLMAGRDFTAADHLPGSPPVAWLAHRFWQREFGGDRLVVGRRIPIEDREGGVAHVQIAGILGPEVASFDLNNRPPDVVMAAFPERDFGPNRLSFPIVKVPRDLTVEQAQARIGAALQAAAPAPDGGTREVRLRSLRDYQVAGGKPTARVIFAGALLVLALAAINLVHLLLTRGEAKAAEIATRAALGASRWRVARLFLAESLLLGASGIGAGLLLGYWLSGVIAAAVPQFPSGSRNLALVPVLFNARAVVFALTLGLLVALVGTAWPAWRALRRPALLATRRAAGISTGVSARLSRGILASELAVATIVLAGTLFIGLGIWRYLNQPIGFDIEGRFRVHAQRPIDQPLTVADLAAALDAARAIPGVQAAGVYDTDNAGVLEMPGYEAGETRLFVAAAGPGYFETWNRPLHSGRWFEAEEYRSEAPVAIVNGTLAELVWPDTSAIGQQVRTPDGMTRTVVGMVEPRLWNLARPPFPEAYVPAMNPPDYGVTLVLWAPGLSVADLRAQAAVTLAGALAGATVDVSALTFDDIFVRSIGEARFQAPIIAAFGAFAFLLAGIGVFGLVSYLVERRRHEFGIRLAIGARPHDIHRAVFRQSIVPAAIGLTVGLAGAWMLETIVEASVFGWESSVVAALVGVTVALLAVAVTAAMVPARRALRIDPIMVLRSE